MMGMAETAPEKSRVWNKTKSIISLIIIGGFVVSGLFYYIGYLNGYNEGQIKASVNYKAQVKKVAQQLRKEEKQNVLAQRRKEIVKKYSKNFSDEAKRQDFINRVNASSMKQLDDFEKTYDKLYNSFGIFDKVP